MNNKKTFSTGGFYVGIERGGDIYTNEAIYKLLNTMNLSAEFVGKKYKGEDIKVWNVPYAFIKTLYISKWELRLKFVVYIEIDFSLQCTRLYEPAVQKKAKQNRSLRRALRKKGP